MKLRSPIVAMLWELWRVTRAEIAWKLALPIGVGLAALLLGAAFAPARQSETSADVNDAIAAFALILIVIPQLVRWMSIAKLNGGQPGFPLYLAYTRPVRTAVIVGLADGVSHRRVVGDIPRVGDCPEGDLGLCVPTAARRRVDRGPRPGRDGGCLVDTQQGRSRCA